MANNLLLLSGNSHPELAQSIAVELDTNLVAATIDKFPDGETRVKIADNVREEDVFVVQPTGPPTNQNIMESLVMIDALRRASAGRITAVMPYYGYARQDRKDASRVPITAKLVTNLFEAAGANRLLSVDLHAHQIQGFTDIPFDHLYAANTIVSSLKGAIKNLIVAAPDVGASKMARGFANRLETEWAIVDKDRIDGSTTQVAAIIGHSVADRNVLIVDDVVTTGTSLINAAKSLKESGASQVIAAVTHGVLCGNAIGEIEASTALDQLYVTDSLPEDSPTDKIKRITIAPLLARAISNIHNGESVSELF